KLDGTAEQALQQISDKSYALPFGTGDTKVFRIGLNFSSETRNIERWIIG
ncbi:MAG: PD-(D/E)XK nuclease domain-containing protein, partial [Paraprevotella sp.]|nr:PD-(D/E)XK nuclease domain-containing protein [Paraprevotella sp.]